MCNGTAQCRERKWSLDGQGVNTVKRSRKYFRSESLQKGDGGSWGTALCFLGVDLRVMVTFGESV
jgi:hypothetical protein